LLAVVAGVIALVASQVAFRVPRPVEAEVEVLESYWWLPPESAPDAPRKTNLTGVGTPTQLKLVLNDSDAYGRLRLEVMQKRWLSPYFDSTYDEVDVGSLVVDGLTDVIIDYRFRSSGEYYAYVYWNDKSIHRTSDIRVILTVEYVG